MTETATQLKPVNGVLRGSKCLRLLNDPGAYWSDIVDEAKIKGTKAGAPCPLCKTFREAGSVHISYPSCKAEVWKTTILGPIHVVESAGNPLIDAAAILRIDGWVHGNWVCDQGKKCLAGAVRAACGILPDPETEGSEFAEKYVRLKWYKDGKKKSARALVTLALEIFETENPKPKLEDFKSDHWDSAKGQYRDALDQWERDREDAGKNPDSAIEIITNFNDSVLSRKGKRKAAIALLEKAAAKFNPRMRLESYDY